MADDPQDGAEQGKPDGTLDERVSGLETGQQALAGKIDQILGILGSGEGDGGHDDEPTSTGGTNIAHEIRAQLDERDRKAKADADAKAHGDRVGALEARVSELAEKPPEPMPRRVEKLMWGSR